MKKQLSQKPSNIKENVIMTIDTKEQDAKGIDRRHFLVAGAAGAAGLAAAGVGLGKAWAQPKAPDSKALWTNVKTGGKRVAVITDTQLNIGPYLARKMAKANYNLVIADPLKGLPEELRKLGAEVTVVPGLEQEGPNNESKPGSIQKVVDAAMKKYGGFDSAFIRTAIHAPKGDIFETTTEGMFTHYEQNYLAVMYALQAVLPPLMKFGAGQVVVQTSATSEKPQPTMMAYSTMRAAAAMLVRCAAMTVAPKGVCVNAVGTNFMNYPGFREASGAQDPKVFQKILDEIPMRRLGETEEAAHFTMALLDGYNMYTTGNFFPIAGGFNNAGMEPF
ncbi:MAG: SDR family oxidoreductase [Desulfobulbaceae bacterium]|nr:SDR family oxidoreductase [Desulfobulbaceae bacterium]